ncbi:MULTISPECIES: HAD-IC family P-type ATPase [unclassified Pseudonocardia]|uniref:HAD-IC family P-type ATPase n=1 Tax=unclassified Pseudonocardia TaxID=2619320 RepID=UPI00143AC686|nr:MULTISPECIES: HAD-IC family P-type ATPase [unclassified Pseudonocardia]
MTSRSTFAIVRANVLTPFNGLLFVLFLLIVATGRWQNGLFGLLIVANTTIGVVQEVRAKRTLDRLAVVNAPHARVVRDGVVSEIGVGDVVADELIELRSGDQVAADGVVLWAAGLEVDDSLLTGESDPIHKEPGDGVRSGSVVVTGRGRFRATAIGPDAYATRLTVEAKKFTKVSSELVGGTNMLLRWISVMMLIVAPLLVWSQFRSPDTHTWQDAVTGTVAALVGMVPEGLVLLTSLAFMLGAVSLARRQTLVQELPAVEGLARVDVVCLDKTGTLTHGDIVFDRLVMPTGADPLAEAEVREALALCAAGLDKNPTTAALAAVFDNGSWQRTGGVPFSSARKWSAVTTRGHGTWVLGAPEIVFPGEYTDPLLARAGQIAAQGHRVLVLAMTHTTTHATPAGQEGQQLPEALKARALVVLGERIREDAEATLCYFTEQGVSLRVISGDNPHTVGAVAVAVGLPGITHATDAVDARTLPEDQDELAAILQEKVVFGRVTPQQKRAIVGALQKRGHIVAMTGDGVNDTMALKDADIGVAMGNGAPATRAVAQLILLDGRFAHLPDIVAEGRRVIANIERAANLFVIKNAYALLIAIVAIATSAAYPLAPIQLTLISSLAIGIPGLVLALAPNHRRYVPGFLPRVLRLAIPIGILIGAAAYAGDRTIRWLEPTGGLTAGQTVATTTALLASLWALTLFTRPFNTWKLALVGALALIGTVILATPTLATDIFLMAPTWPRLGLGLALGTICGLLIETTAHITHARHTARDL